MGGSDVKVSIITKIGGDIIGDLIMNKLESDGINTDRVARGDKSQTSGFSYIIVNTSTQSRTCIHTPASSYLQSSEVEANFIKDCSIVFSDGRFPGVVLNLLRQHKVMFYLECERLLQNDSLLDLVPFADFILTSSNFPLQYHEHLQKQNKFSYDCLFHLFDKMKGGDHSHLITTLGSRGSVCITRCDDGSDPADDMSIDEVIALEDDGVASELPNLRLFNIKYCKKSYTIIRCGIWKTHPFEIKDTTGAGDTFNGACLYWLTRSSSQSKLRSLGGMMQFASIMSFYCASEIGVRKGVANNHVVKQVIKNILN
ncbi:hypothetical protein AKO1_009269, partial [Acrasis kona]